MIRLTRATPQASVDIDLSDLQGEHRARVESLLERKSELVQLYPERRYVLGTFLPHAQGLVLNVGISRVNAGDWEALRVPSMMRSLDIDPQQAPYGSPYGHTVGDWLHASLGTSFDTIIMFGCIGSRNGRAQSDPHIELDAADEALRIADLHLAGGGSLLLGIELVSSGLAAWRADLKVWRRWVATNELLREKFVEVDRVQGRHNLVVTMTKWQT